MLSLLVAAGVFSYAAIMALKAGADVIRADSWRFLFIYGDFVVNKGGSILDAALNDHHFDILNVVIFLTDYRLFHLSGYAPSFLGFFSAVVLALAFLWGITYRNRLSLQNKTLGILVAFLVLPTTFITFVASQYITWNLVALVSFKLLIVYGVLLLSYLPTSSKSLSFIYAMACAFLVSMLTNSIATLVCLSFIASSLVVFGLTGRINGYRVIGILAGILLASYCLRQLGFSGASPIVSFDSMDLVQTLYKVIEGAALALFSPLLSKELVDAYKQELLALHLFLLVYAAYSIYTARHSNVETVVIILSLYVLYLATYISALLFRFGVADPVGVAFVPRYYPMYLCGSAALALLVYNTYLIGSAYFDKVMLLGFFFVFMGVKLVSFYEFSSAYGYTKNHFDKVRVAIFCYMTDQAFPDDSPSLSNEKKLEAIKFIDNNNLSVFYLENEGFFNNPLSCAKDY